MAVSLVDRTVTPDEFVPSL